MTRLATRTEMNQDGWTNEIINGVDCIKLDNDSGILVAEWSQDGWTSSDSMDKITAVMGQPYKVHTLSDAGADRISSIEY